MLRIERLVPVVVIALSAPAYASDDVPAGFSAEASNCSDAFGGIVGPGPGTGISLNPASVYANEIEKQVAPHWRPEGGEESRPAIVVFSVNRNGEISRVRLKQSSQTFSLDEAALKAIKLSNPLNKIPPSLADSYSVQFTFNTNFPSAPSAVGLPGVFGTLVVPEEACEPQAKINWAPYVRQLERGIGNRWHQAESSMPADAQVQLRIFRDGSIADLKLRERTLVKAIDQSVLEAVKLSSPFAPLPAGAPESVLCYLNFEQRRPVVPIPTNWHAPSLAAQPDVDFGPYMADLQRRVKAAWQPLEGARPGRSVLVFKIRKNGQVSNLRLERPSNSKELDQSAMQTIMRAAPFRPLPEGASDDVDIQFTFDANSNATKGPLRACLNRFYVPVGSSDSFGF